MIKSTALGTQGVAPDPSSGTLRRTRPLRACETELLVPPCWMMAKSRGNGKELSRRAVSSHGHRPSLGPPRSPAPIFPNVAAEPFGLTVSGRTAKKLFSPFGQLGNGSTESLRGHAAGQRQSWAPAPAPRLPPHSPAWLCGGSSRRYLLPPLSVPSALGTGPWVIKAPRDRKPSSNIRGETKSKTKQQQRGDRDIPRRDMGVPPRT